MGYSRAIGETIVLLVVLAPIFIGFILESVFCVVASVKRRMLLVDIQQEIAQEQAYKRCMELVCLIGRKKISKQRAY